MSSSDGAADEGLERLLDGIWRRRRGELLERLDVLAEALGRPGEGSWSAAGAEAHRLVGALGSLGFEDLARQVRAVELAVAGGSPGAGAASLLTVAHGVRAALEGTVSRPRHATG